VFVAREPVLVDHSPAPGRLPGAHDPSRLENLAVVEGVAVSLEVGGQVVGRLADPRADDERQIGVLDGVEVARRQHPGVSHHDQISGLVAFLEAVEHGQQGGGLGGIALEAVHFEREPGPVDEQPDLDLWVDPALLAHPDLAQRVLVLRLEMQRGDVVENEAQRAIASGVGQAGARELAAVVALLAAGQRAEQGPHRRGGSADLLEDPDGVGLRGRLDHPGQDHRSERLVGQGVEPEPVMGATENVPQRQRRRAHHTPTRPVRAWPPLCRCWDGICSRRAVGIGACPVRGVADPRRLGRQLSEVESLLTRLHALTRRRQQQRELGIGVSGTDVLDLHGLTVVLDHQLDRDRARGRPHPTHEP
jgi:hypothetical protein